MISIVLEKYGKSGWKFTITDDDPYARGIQGTYRTNETGSGLWEIFPESFAGDERQIAVPHAFRLPSERKRAYARLRYLHIRGLTRR